MRSLLLSIIALFFLTNFLSAQTLVLTYEGEALANNATVMVEGDYMAAEIIAELDVTNTGGAEMGVLVQRTEISMIPGTISYFCWGLCYDPSTNLTPYPITIGAGATNDIDFSAHYSPSGNMGESTIKFEFFDENNPTDVATVTFVFNGTTVSTNENIYAESFNVFPVPANEQLNVSGTTEIETNFMLYTTNGALVKEVKQLNTSNQINISDLSEGVYLYRIISGTELIKSGRIVVKH